jgi:hypothetical protein
MHLIGSIFVHELVCMTLASIPKVGSTLFFMLKVFGLNGQWGNTRTIVQLSWGPKEM